MKALLTLKSAINQSSFFATIALTIIAPLAFPHLAAAAELQTSGQTLPVFEIKITDPSLLQANNNPSNNNQNSLSIDTIKQADPLINSLNAYLADHQSPLAGSADQLVTFNNWPRAIGISLVESHMCEFTPKVKTSHGWVESYNCSGMETGSGGYQIFDSYVSWFAAMNNLLNQPNYANRPIEKFIGYYVQPGSVSWLWGVKNTEKELNALADQAATQRQQIAQDSANNFTVTTALTTFADNVN